MNDSSKARWAEWWPVSWRDEWSCSKTLIWFSSFRQWKIAGCKRRPCAIFTNSLMLFTFFFFLKCYDFYLFSLISTQFIFFHLFNSSWLTEELNRGKIIFKCNSWKYKEGTEIGVSLYKHISEEKKLISNPSSSAAPRTAVLLWRFC